MVLGGDQTGTMAKGDRGGSPGTGETMPGWFRHKPAAGIHLTRDMGTLQSSPRQLLRPDQKHRVLIPSSLRLLSFDERCFHSCHPWGWVWLSKSLF